MHVHAYVWMYVCAKDSYTYMCICHIIHSPLLLPIPLPLPSPPLPHHRNELERVQLENLQFNINVSPSTYAKFYFDLRSLAEENGLLFPEEYVPLTRDRATKIEVCKRVTCTWSVHIHV